MAARHRFVAALPAAALWVSACSTTLPPEGADADLGRAVSQPLQDLSIQQIKIPEPLKAALAAPYAPAPGDCRTLAAEVEALDRVLGPDLDQPRGEDDLDDTAMKLLEGAVRDFAAGWIPFRSGVRRLTGAEARLQKAQAAIRAGAIRRAYLKGAGDRMRCTPPGAPLRSAPPPPLTPGEQR